MFGIELLITVAIASGGVVSSIYMMLHGLERQLDSRLDAIEMAIAKREGDLVLINERIERLEDHENQEARHLRTVLSQVQAWIDVVASPVNTRTDP